MGSNMSFKQIDNLMDHLLEGNISPQERNLLDAVTEAEIALYYEIKELREQSRIEADDRILRESSLWPQLFHTGFSIVPAAQV